MNFKKSTNSFEIKKNKLLDYSLANNFLNNVLITLKEIGTMENLENMKLKKIRKVRSMGNVKNM